MKDPVLLELDLGYKSAAAVIPFLGLECFIETLRQKAASLTF